jgi:hypothetical protein
MIGVIFFSQNNNNIDVSKELATVIFHALIFNFFLKYLNYDYKKNESNHKEIVKHSNGEIILGLVLILT